MGATQGVERLLKSDTSAEYTAAFTELGRLIARSTGWPSKPTSGTVGWKTRPKPTEDKGKYYALDAVFQRSEGVTNEGNVPRGEALTAASITATLLYIPGEGGNVGLSLGHLMEDGHDLWLAPGERQVFFAQPEQDMDIGAATTAMQGIIAALTLAER